MQTVFIMLDGLRPDAISPERTPTLCGFMDKGSSTLAARSVFPSITLPCHTSIFHSVPPERHGIVENVWHAMARPVVGLVDHLRLHNKRATHVYNWEPLRDMNRPERLWSSHFRDNEYQLSADEFIAHTAISHFNAGGSDFTFVYFGTIDLSGHFFGWMSAQYLEQATVVDGLLERVLAAAGRERAVIIQSDHGGHDRNHGTDLPEDMTIFWTARGPGIRIGHRIQREVSLLDTAPTVARLLRVPIPAEWEGTPPDEIFDEEGA